MDETHAMIWHCNNEKYKKKFHFNQLKLVLNDMKDIKFHFKLDALVIVQGPYFGYCPAVVCHYLNVKFKLHDTDFLSVLIHLLEVYKDNINVLVINEKNNFENAPM